MTPSPTVLLIEDDHDTRVELRVQLEAEGYLVASAANGLAGLMLLQRMRTPVEFIILDLNMPLMNGEEFLALLKKVPEYADIPVLVISAIRAAKPEGAFRFFPKPFDLDALLGSLKTYLAAKGAA